MINIYENEIPMAVRNDGRKSVMAYSHNDWARKVSEETGEALTAGSADEMAEEIADIITVCTSWLESMGYDFEERKRIFKQVNMKNNKRGYFDYMER